MMRSTAYPYRRQRGERAARLRGHDRFRREDETHRGQGRVGQHRPHRFQLVGKLQQCLKDAVGRDRLAPAEHDGEGPHAAGQPPMGREHLLQVPTERLGQGEQPERLGRRRAVHDDRVPLTTRGQVAHGEQGQNLLDPGQDGELLGRDRVDAAPSQDVDQVPLHVSPRDFEAMLRIDLHGPQAGIDLDRFAAERAGPGHHPANARHRSTGAASSRHGRRDGSRSRRRSSSCRRRPCR